MSYDGLTAGLTLLHPHPALKAISEQASPVDQWMNDDMHRYGALRESYAFEYSVLEQADKNTNTHFDFDTYDTYHWYLNLGPLTQANAKYLHGSLPFWNDLMAHPDYDAFWKKEAWVNQLHSSTVPNLNVAGFWDQEDPWGPWQIFRHAEEQDPNHTNLMVAGPWFHGEWQTPEGDQHRHRPIWRTQDLARIPREHRSTFLPLLPARRGREAGLEGDDVPDGIEYLAQLYDLASGGRKPTNLYLHADGTLFIRAEVRTEAQISAVRLRSGQPGAISGCDRSRRRIPNRRLADLGSCRSALCRQSPGCADIRERAARSRCGGDRADCSGLYASTSGTDRDFVVKLIDVFPESKQTSADDIAAGKAKRLHRFAKWI